MMVCVSVFDPVMVCVSVFDPVMICVSVSSSGDDMCECV